MAREGFSSTAGEAIEEEEDVLTLGEYLEKEEELYAEAIAKYPAKFDKCSYGEENANGKRQELFVCLTCLPKDVDNTISTLALCYACSIACHPKCELIELGLKRGVTCSCGVSPFTTACTLCPAKDFETDNNAMTAVIMPQSKHNFVGRFCVCDQKYDDEVDVGDMLQCLVCEDWFHEACLPDLPMKDQYFDELICPRCVECFPFLNALGQVSIKSSELNADEPVDIESTSVESQSQGDSKKQKISICLSSSNDNVSPAFKALYLKKDFRSILCNCSTCKELLCENKIAFLAETEPVYEPEADKEATTPPLDCRDDLLFVVLMYDLVAANILDRTVNRAVAINGIRAMEKFKNALMNHLKSHLAEGRVVTKEVSWNIY